LDLYATTHAPSSIYQAPIFIRQYPLAYSENLFGIALFAFPFISPAAPRSSSTT